MKSKRILLLLVLLFFAPLLASFAMYYGLHWRPAGQTNHGTLIAPPRPLPAGPADVFHGKWSLVYLGTGDCDQECRSTLYFMRQTYLGLGHLIPRLQQVFLVTTRCCDRAFLEREHAGLITVDSAVPEAAALPAQFPIDARASTLFIVDPRGNLMMRYDAHADPKGLHDDLVKLLNLSHIG